MSGNSSRVHSGQRACHDQLASVVNKHLASPWRGVPAAHTRSAFEAIRAQVEATDRPLVFDSFCGTAMSTSALAERHPDHTVIGIDQSARRLSRHARANPANLLLVQAECGDFWRLAVEAGWRLARHFLLYPNPWPKPAHLKRRVHGSPDFAALLSLGGAVELRSNWQIYTEEFGCALALAGHTPTIDRVVADEPITLHERKYQNSQHELWRCRCQLGHNSGPQTAAT